MSEGTLQDRLDALVGKPIGDTGPSVAPDPVKARDWYIKAAAQGSQEATRRLERLATR